LRGGVYPIIFLETGRKLDGRELAEPRSGVSRGKQTEILQLFFESVTLDRKFVIVLDHFTEKTGEKSERNALEGGEIVEREFLRLRGIGAELFGFEIRGEHESYNISEIGLP
jgi:hypothetical protein